MGFRLMIVDDSSSMRSIVKRTVEMSGFDVEQFLEADNGKTALEILDNEWVDVILSDLNMPVMDGEAFLAALKENPMFSEIPVVVVTTEGRNEKLQQLRNLGAAAFVKKPFKPEVIRDTLVRALGLDSLDGLGEDDGDDMDF
ncbi:response regulator [Desulfatibacillum aliphaticivorans]|uniref:response regulator n=1 Tax=Desulfatibacillum aliphaticivorans TaxID=218208 RepID=UPI000420B181|nr:response regulator [Desulfatibacillum aliphaticivorans]